MAKDANTAERLLDQVVILGHYHFLIHSFIQQNTLQEEKMLFKMLFNPFEICKYVDVNSGDSSFSASFSAKGYDASQIHWPFFTFASDQRAPTVTRTRIFSFCV